MRAETSLRRLAEMDVDVYVPRPTPAPASSLAVPHVADAIESTRVAAGVEVFLLADMQTSAAKSLVGDIARALSFARIRCAQSGANDEAALVGAVALVVFGDVQAQAAAAVLPARRQRAINRIVSSEPSALAEEPQAKRALWNELKGMVRALHSIHGLQG